MDILSRYLATFQIKQVLCTRFEATAPWGHEIVNFSQVKFVLVANGSCWLRTRALPQPTRLTSGDLFLVLNGEPYRLSDGPKSKTIDCRQLEKRRNGFLIEYGGGGVPCTLVSVAMEIETLDGRPAHLPSFIHLRIDQTRSHALQNLIDLMRLEVCSAGIGSAAIVQRLSVEIAKAVKGADIAEKMAADGGEPVGSTPEQFRQHLITEIARWKKVVRDTGLRVE